MDVPYQEEILVDIVLKAGCDDDEVINLTKITDTLYYIAEDGLVSY